jgi:hypothetical protein
MTSSDDELSFPSDYGMCDLCGVEPIAEPGESFCVMCRIEVVAAMQVITDPVERLLSEHWSLLTNRDVGRSDEQWTLCRCNRRFEGGPAFHRRHVAEEIYKGLQLPPPEPWKAAADEIGDDDG